MRKKILIFGNYGVPNWGDEAILSGILSQIDTLKFAVTVVSSNPEWTTSVHGVPSIPPPPGGIRSFLSLQWIQTLKRIKNADCIIFGGGGLWQAKPVKALKLWDLYLRICLFYNAKIFFLGQSFESITSRHITEGMKKRLSKVKFFSVRDAQSVHTLKTQWNIHPSKIHLSADAAFFTEHEGEKNSSSSRKIITFSMREGDITEEEEKKILEVTKRKFPNAVFQNLVMQSHQSGDENFAKRHTMPSIHPMSLEDVYNTIAKSTLVVSSRLHANIISSTLHTPFVAIACREKVSHLFGTNFSIASSHILTPVFEKSYANIIDSQMHSPQKQKDFLQEQHKKLSVFFPKTIK